MYAILTQTELDKIDLSKVEINGKNIRCVPIPSVDGTLFSIQGDQFNQFTLKEIIRYKKYRPSNWQ